MRKLSHLVKFVVLVTVGCLLCSPSRGQVDPDIEWKSWKFKHFELIYDAKHQKLAEIYASRLVEAAQLLEPLFPEIPELTTFVINDNTDLTNGFATPIPYPLIMIFPVLPSPFETVSEYGDWERELIIHEFSHVLALTARRDTVKALTYIFGSIMAPNLLLPRWWHEGLAVDLETRFSQHGRLRSSFQDGVIRSYILGEEFWKIAFDEINEVTIPTWPYGARPYLYGSYLWSHMINKNGTEIIKNLTTRYSGRFPYVINGPAEDETGKSYPANFREMKAELFDLTSAQINTLKRVPETPATQLDLPYVEHFNPSISPDGLKMAFLAKDETTRRSVQIMSRSSLAVPFSREHLNKGVGNKDGEGVGAEGIKLPKFHDEEGPPGGTIQRVSWFPDSKRFIYDKHGEIDRFKSHSDLWIYDLETKKSTQVTSAARAREPHVSPDGKKVVFVKLAADQTSLCSLEFESKVETCFWKSEFGERFSHPLYVNENEVIASLRIKGEEQLFRIRLLEKTKVRLLSQWKNPMFVEKSQDSFLFLSQQNGVFNVYEADKNFERARPLTHSYSQVSTYARDPGGFLYFSELKSQGWKLSVRSPLTERLPPSLPSVEPLLANRYPATGQAPKDRVEIEKLDLLTNSTIENYSSLGYLIPRYWFPSIFITPSGTSGSIATAASDPLNKHAFNLALLYDSESKRGSYSFVYQNNTLTPELSFTSYLLNQYLLVEGISIRSNLNRAQALWQLLFLSPDWNAGVGWTWLGRDYSIFRTYQLGPSLFLNYQDFAQLGAQISPEGGQGLSLSYTEFLPENDRIHYRTGELSLVKYSSWLLPKRHALMAKFQGQYLDRNVPLANYTITTGIPVFANTAFPQYMVRGYPSAQFLGKTLGIATLEYRFPIMNLFHGPLTFPLFLKRIHGAIVGDGLWNDGYGFQYDSKSYRATDPWKSIWGAGAELKLDLTLGYHFPFTFFYGVYAPLDKSWKTDSTYSVLGILF